MVAPSKHVPVVGASSGSGLGIAKELAPIIAKLMLCSRSYPAEVLETNKTNKTINPSVEVVREKLDVSLLHEVRKFMLVHDMLEGLNRPGVRVLNVLAGGIGGAIDVDDLDLKHTYSTKRCAEATTQYSDLMAQAFAEHAPKASFMHAYQGLSTRALGATCRGTCVFRSRGLPQLQHAPLPESCSNYIVSGLFNGDYATGWYLLSRNAKVVSKTQYHTEELKDIVWKHTLKTTNDIIK
ncbi:hypothetical protein BBO99_00006862 [Phytophthora kernoviae]|uniref:Uncharacterized protein n=2 Tax=Phytophthora kernoviae TaxID=325452 RepID=A0A3R7JXD1_9STRA|nr:hypothetical protein G195_009107 [Phytophthora kernoviae 00238/432]KAG2504668.1 hypothetical protein JM16_009307 [Phytophthora kernoviae]KAG2507386.1 hypothetical protein JM18_009287 [Phytophthora kernoviae]RLN32766.1 hypothetical protein BBI17_009554 [Phytophthora kernoviae]RLN77308.1 hypothetical protein BBO99_00006862 [Phytophthora kernoviae]